MLRLKLVDCFQCVMQVSGSNPSAQHFEIVDGTSDTLRIVKANESTIFLEDLNAHVPASTTHAQFWTLLSWTILFNNTTRLLVTFCLKKSTGITRACRTNRSCGIKGRPWGIKLWGPLLTTYCITVSAVGGKKLRLFKATVVSSAVRVLWKETTRCGDR